MSFPAELQDRYQHTDPEVRLQAIDELESSAEDAEASTAAQQIFVQIASTDPDNRVRSAAAHKVTDIALLELLCQQIRQKDKAVYKFCKEKLDAVHRAQAQQAAAAARSREICQSLESLAAKVPGPLTEAQRDYLLAQWNQSQGPSDDELQQRVSVATAALEETLSQFLRERSQEQLLQQSMEQLGSGYSSAEAMLAGLHVPIDGAQMQQLEQHLSELQSLLAAFPGDMPEASSGTDPRELLSACQALVSRISSYRKAWHHLESHAAEIEKLRESISKVSPRDSKALTSLHKRLGRLTEEADWPQDMPDSSNRQRLIEARKLLQERSSANTDWRKQKGEEAAATIAELDQAIEQGHLAEARKLWDRINSALSHAADEQRLALQEQLAPYKLRLTELQDWKNFAATEKKKELIERMQKLVELNQPPPQKAKSIRALQEDWKKLGHSDDNDALWTQFNEVARVAFEPCKEYFKERKERMSANLKERIRICEELEAYIATLDPQTLNISDTGKIEATAQAEWKKYAPVAQNKIKQLQKRFNAILNTLRQMRRKTLQQNAERKLELIGRAEKLLELEDVQEAIGGAKSLQAEWKGIGPSPYKDDRDHWNRFRKACDAVFERRDEQARQHKAQVKKVASAARDTLKQLNALLGLSDEDFLQSRKQFTQLRDDFHAQLNPDMKAERRQLIEQFETFSKKYENRHRAAPDKKSLQLINQLRERAGFCENLENAALKEEQASLPGADELQQQWQALEAVADADLARRLDKRFRSLLQNIADSAKMKKLAADNETVAQELCVEMEIQAGLDSPAQDKALRMMIQLNHLKQGLGQARNAGRSKAQVVSELEMQFLCIGPLDEQLRRALQLRINGIKAKSVQ